MVEYTFRDATKAPGWTATELLVIAVRLAREQGMATEEQVYKRASEILAHDLAETLTGGLYRPQITRI